MPFANTKHNYGAKIQFAQSKITVKPVDKKTKQFIQQVCRQFLYLGQAVNSTHLMPISAITSQQANPIEETLEQTMQILDYITSQEEALLTYSASNMLVAVHSDASYLSVPKARR